MASHARRLPAGITRVHPHTRRTLRSATDLAVCPHWVWRVRVRRRGVGEFDRLYPQDVRDTLQETLDYLSRERTTAVHDLRRDGTGASSRSFAEDVRAYLARRASVSDYGGRKRSLAFWEAWLTGRVGASFKTTAITAGLVELALEEWKGATVMRRARAGR